MLEALLLVGSFSSVVSMGLPSYISPCSRNDPNLNECALKSARESIHQFSLGDPERNLHPLDPLYVEEMVVYIPNKQGFKVVFKDNYFKGLSNLHMESLKIYMNTVSKKSSYTSPLVITSISSPQDCHYDLISDLVGDICIFADYTMDVLDPSGFDLEKKMIIADALLTLDVKNHYELSGKLLMVPIDSKGDSSINLKNTLLHIRYWYEHVEGPDGKVHWKIFKNDIKYEVEKASFRLENLLNDKNIGDQINKLLNEMWREVVAEVGPSICHSLGSAVAESLSILLEQVSYDELMTE